MINYTVTVLSIGEFVMGENVRKLFTIGQFAALYQINKKTLMWYDEIGLFKPAVVGENGYRYYSYQQCPALETILIMRELNISIPEIAAFMKNRCAESFDNVLMEKTVEIDESIRHLMLIKEAVVHQRKQLDELKTIDVSGFSVVEKPEQRLVLMKSAKGTPVEQETEMLLAEVRRHKAYRKYGILYGAILPADSIYRHDFADYRGVFLQIPGAENLPDAHIQPEGAYLRAYSKGSWDKLPGKYCEILDYARQKGLRLRGYAYETGINDIISNSEDDYITRIEIPVETD